MLGNKRRQTNSKGRAKSNNKSNNGDGKKITFKAKSYSNKKAASKREDEEIASESENENLNQNDMSDDDFFEKNSQNDENAENQKESADAKRLRLARKLISNIDGKLKLSNNIEGNDLKQSETTKKDLDEYLKEEMQKENNEFKLELYNKINPQHKIFLKAHHASVTALDISSDSKSLITASKDCRAMKWDIETNKKFLLPQFSKRQLLTCIFAPDDKNAFFAGADRHIYQVDVHNENVIQSFKAHNDTITGLIFDINQEQYYSIGNDKKLNVWGVSPTQKSILLETFYGHVNRINDLDVLISNKVISCGADSLINLWKIDTQSFLKFQSNDSFNSVIDNLKTLNLNTFITGGYDGTVSVWKTNKKKPQNKVINAHGFYKEFSAEHDFFYNSDKDNLLNYELNEGVNNLNLSSSANIKIPNPICSLATIKNSDLIFSGSMNGKINIYRCFEGNKIEHINNIDVARGSINTIKINKTNEFMVVGYGKDQRLGRWFSDNNAKTGISIVKLFNE